MQNKFITLISKIKEHPTAFLGKRSLQLLRIYIDGYLYAMRQEEIDCGESVYYAFNEWLAKKYDVRESILWDCYLPNVCDDINEVFDLFFEEFFHYIECIDAI